MKSSLLLVALLALAAVPFGCGEDAGVDGQDGGGTNDGGGGSSGKASSGGSSGTPSDAGSCDRTARPDDAPRFVVASRPYDAEANESKRYSIFSLTSTGVVAPLSEFELAGPQFNGNIDFTLDGELGAVALEGNEDEARGGVAIFRLSAEGVPTVVHAAFKAEFYADAVRFSPDGKWLYVSDSSTIDNGGGLYAIPVACDGTLGTVTRVTQSSGASIPVWMNADPTRAWAAGHAFATAPTRDDNLHLLSLVPPKATRLGSGNVFGQPTAIRTGAVSTDDRYVVLSAWNELVGGPRIIAARLEGDNPALEGEWGPDQGLLGGAEVVLASPFGNSFFATSADGNGAYFLPFYGAAGAPDGGAASDAGADAGPTSKAFGSLQRVAYATGAPELSSSGIVLRRGALKGRVVLGENVAIRQFQFQPDGTVTDVSETVLSSDGDDVSEIVGAIGVTP